MLPNLFQYPQKMRQTRKLVGGILQMSQSDDTIVKIQDWEFEPENMLENNF
jgi:hypothetical protein